MAAISSAYEPKYPEKWDSQHFFYKCPKPIEDTQNVTAVMTALNSDVKKIFRVLKNEKHNMVEPFSVPNIGEFKISATGKNLEELADRIDSMLGEGFVFFVEPIHQGRATTYVTFDTIQLNLWRYNIKCPPSMEFNSFASEIMEFLPNLYLPATTNQPIGQFNLHLIPMKV